MVESSVIKRHALMMETPSIHAYSLGLLLLSPMIKETTPIANKT